MNHWYVVHTRPQCEELARCNLERQGFTVYLPLFRRMIRHARRKSEVLRPFFPRYLFVAFDPAVARWRAVNSTLGVARLISEGETPVAVDDDVVDDIRRRADVDGVLTLDEALPFAVGDRIQVREGPFRDFWGLFHGLDDKSRVCVLLDLMGRSLRLTLPRQAVVP